MGPNGAPEEIRELSFEHPVVFFDGVCGLCNGVVDWLVERDRHGLFRFAPLQGPTAQALLPSSDIESMNSIVLLKEGTLYRKSSAALHILEDSGGWISRLALPLRLIPNPLRDWVYALIARNRYGWFGKKDTCRLPTPEERSRFLD